MYNMLILSCNCWGPCAISSVNFQWSIKHQYTHCLIVQANNIKDSVQWCCYSCQHSLPMKDILVWDVLMPSLCKDLDTTVSNFLLLQPYFYIIHFILLQLNICQKEAGYGNSLRSKLSWLNCYTGSLSSLSDKEKWPNPEMLGSSALAD